MEFLRQKLHEAIDKFGLGSIEVLELSQELDVLVLSEQIKRFK